MATKKKLLQAAAGNAVGGFTAIEDVFSTYLYTGNGSTQTITNGIDLAGGGGLVWLKSRSLAEAHQLFDTDRGIYNRIFSNSTAAQSTSTNTLTAFNSDGFSISDNNISNTSGSTNVSWTFRKAPRFFDVVTYTGTGSSNPISHNLGVLPGCMIFKKTSASEDWYIFNRNNSGAYYSAVLNSSNAAVGPYTAADLQVTDTTFNPAPLGSNTNGASYVAYLFAHDPLGPSGDGSDGLIACGSHTNSAEVNELVDLGWEPQWILTKKTNVVDDWKIFDVMRGLYYDVTGKVLKPNTSDAEADNTASFVRNTGFTLRAPAGHTSVYIAIRRGPMRPPESGSEVFDVSTATNPAPRWKTLPAFPVDMAFWNDVGGVAGETRDFFWGDRLRGDRMLKSTLTFAEADYSPFFASSSLKWDYQNGFYSSSTSGSTQYAWMFRRAPEFFDMVAYTGNGVNNRQVPHNLGVAPELMIIKIRTTNFSWAVYSASEGVSKVGFLNSSNAFTTTSASFYWNNTQPTSDVFTLGTVSNVNRTGDNFIAYLFASRAGVSKVGSYTGNGTNQTINCGFTTGARFVLIKRTDSTGNWYVWDTARGIVTGNDPYLSLNTTAAEVTTNDSVDPDSSGFIVNQVAGTNINVNAASYIYLAIA